MPVIALPAPSISTPAPDDDEKECDSLKDQVKKDAETVKAKDAEIATLKQQLKDSEMTPDKIDAVVRDHVAVIASAKKIMGDKFTTDKLSVQQIRRAVVDAKLGNTAKGWTDDQILVSYNTIAASAPTRGGVQDAVTVFSGRPGAGYGATQDADPRDAAYNDMVKDLQDAWKGPQQKTA